MSINDLSNISDTIFTDPSSYNNSNREHPMDPMLQDKTFTLWWLDGTRNVVQGLTIADAFTKAGYGGGALAALDWYDNGDVDTHVWNKATHQWDRRLGEGLDGLGLTQSESQELSEEIMDSGERAMKKHEFNNELVKNYQDIEPPSLGSLMNQYFDQTQPLESAVVTSVTAPDEEFKIDDSYPTAQDIQEQKERAAKAQAYVEEHQGNPIGQKQHVRIVAQIQMVSTAKGLPLSNWEDVNIDLIMTDKHKAFGANKEKLREAAVEEIGFKHQQLFINRLKLDRNLARTVGGVKWKIATRNLIVVNLATTPLYAWELDDDYENRGFESCFQQRPDGTLKQRDLDDEPADDVSFQLAP